MYVGHELKKEVGWTVPRPHRSGAASGQRGRLCLVEDAARERPAMAARAHRRAPPREEKRKMRWRWGDRQWRRRMDEIDEVAG